MPATEVIGYNIALKLGSKTLVGVTQDDLTISNPTKTSITKDDAGVKQKKVTGHEGAFKVSGVMKVDTTTGTATVLDSDDILALALGTSPTAFTYNRGTGKALSGNCIITGYSESSSADPDTDATYTLDCETTGALTLAS